MSISLQNNSDISSFSKLNIRFDLTLNKNKTNIKVYMFLYLNHMRNILNLEVKECVREII